MKRLNTILIVFILTACGKQKPSQIAPSSYVTVIDDLTDSFVLRPAADAILAIYDFPNAKDQAADFRLVLITDKRLNPTETIRIADGPTTEKRNEEGQLDNREQLIYNFYDCVRNAISNFPRYYDPTGNPLEHSECFATIASELQLLTQSNSAHRTLIVFGDIQENNDGFSCYTMEGQDLLTTNPDKVAHLLMKRHTLPTSLVGITVYFIYHPRTTEEDSRFEKMITIYKQLLHGRGARVVVQANNTFYQP